jgi:hypothetical protein
VCVDGKRVFYNDEPQRDTQISFKEYYSSPTVNLQSCLQLLLILVLDAIAFKNSYQKTPYKVPSLSPCTNWNSSNTMIAGLGGLVVGMLAIGIKVRGFKPS